MPARRCERLPPTDPLLLRRQRLDVTRRTRSAHSVARDSQSAQIRVLGYSRNSPPRVWRPSLVRIQGESWGEPANLSQTTKCRHDRTVAHLTRLSCSCCVLRVHACTRILMTVCDTDDTHAPLWVFRAASRVLPLQDFVTTCDSRDPRHEVRVSRHEACAN